MLTAYLLSIVIVDEVDVFDWFPVFNFYGGSLHRKLEPHPSLAPRTHTSPEDPGQSVETREQTALFEGEAKQVKLRWKWSSGRRRGRLGWCSRFDAPEILDLLVRLATMEERDVGCRRNAPMMLGRGVHLYLSMGCCRPPRGWSIQPDPALEFASACQRHS